MKKKTTLLLGTILFIITIGTALAAVTSGPTTINVPEGKIAMYYLLDTDQALELRDAICHNYNYHENMTINCNQFAQKKITQYLINNVKHYRKWQHEQQFNPGEDITVD